MSCLGSEPETYPETIMVRKQTHICQTCCKLLMYIFILGIGCLFIAFLMFILVMGLSIDIFLIIVTFNLTPMLYLFIWLPCRHHHQMAHRQHCDAHRWCVRASRACASQPSFLCAHGQANFPNRSRLPTSETA